MQATSNGYKRPAMTTSDQQWLQATSNAIYIGSTTSDQQCYIENSASDQQWPQATSNDIYRKNHKRPAILNRKQFKQPAMATSDQQCYIYKRYCKRPAVLNRKQCKRPESTTSDQSFKEQNQHPGMTTGDQQLQGTEPAPRDDYRRSAASRNRTSTQE